VTFQRWFFLERFVSVLRVLCGPAFRYATLAKPVIGSAGTRPLQGKKLLAAEKRPGWIKRPENMALFAEKTLQNPGKIRRKKKILSISPKYLYTFD
jgi:hypothetical protein